MGEFEHALVVLIFMGNWLDFLNKVYHLDYLIQQISPRYLIPK
jgi:hypothetical protein